MAIRVPSPHSQLWRWEVQKALTALAGAGVSSGPTPPASPGNGQLWWESDTGILWLWVDDGNSQQWVQVGGPMGAAKTARPKNHVTNPCMVLSQENGSNTVTANNSYPADEWVLQYSGIVSSATKTTNMATPDGTQTCVMFQATTAKPTLAATDFLSLAHPFEGLEIADLQWGSGSAKQAVLRFNFYGQPNTTYAFSLINAANDRSYCGSFTTGPLFGWTTVERVIPGDTTGTWPNGAVLAATLRVTVASGSNYVGVPGWQAGNKNSVPGVVNGAATTAQVYLTDVALYPDPDNSGIAPPFVVPDYATELIRCLRYWERGGCFFQSAGTGSAGGATINYAVPKRAAASPTFTNISYPAGTSSLANQTGYVDASKQFAYNITVTAAGGYASFTWTSNARMI